MISKSKYWFIFLIAIIASGSIFLDDDLPQKLDSYHRLVPTEKVYLHINKKIFTAGETIWFKAYLVDGIFHKEDKLSGTLYVDLINSVQKHVVSSKMLQVKNGMAMGDFLIPDSLPTSNYQIRAYTNWMKNFDPHYFYSIELSIYNYSAANPSWTIDSRITRYPNADSVQLYFEESDSDSPAVEYYDFLIRDDRNIVLQEGKVLMQQEKYFKLMCGLNTVDGTERITVTLSNNLYEEQFSIQLVARPIMQFFPEGGDMVSDVVNVVAFELHDSGGNPIEPIGELIDQDSVKIIPLVEIHEGRGLMIFRPQLGKSYMAKIRYEDQWYFYPLPAAQDEGIVLSAINIYPENLAINIVKKDSSGKYPGPFTLVGQVRGKVYWSGKIELSAGSARFKIAKSIFPAGVLQLTLFNRDNLPILERLAFINQQDIVVVDLESEKKIYALREETTIDLSVYNSQGTPIAAKLSATVLDHNRIPGSKSENIVSNLLLSSDIIGPISNPLQYFRNNDKQTQLSLDLLMMTRGWRRFKWEDVINEVSPEIAHLPERGFKIEGSLAQSWNDKPVEDRIVKLAAYGLNPIFLDTRTDALGHFSFSELSFIDTTDLIFQTESKRGKKQAFALRLNSRDRPMVQAKQSKHSIGTTEKNYIAQSKKRKQIELAYIRDTSTIILEGLEIEGYRIDPDEGRLKMHGNADYRLKPDSEEVKRYTTITDYLNTQVPGLVVEGFGADASVASLGAGNPDAPLLLLDGVPLSPSSLINTIPVSMIETIEVIKYTVAVVYGAAGINGLIAIYTKDGATYEPDTKGMVNLKYCGYSVPREFYTPNYSIPKDEHIMPDQRANLMWVPQLQTDSNGDASFTYFNSDLTTKVIVYVEGISEDGIPLVGEYCYEVK